MKKISYLIAIYFICKLILSKTVPLIGDEAYYWVWTQNIQLSYFDHPPFVAWLFKLAELISLPFLGPRWVSIALSVGTIWLWVQIAKQTLSDLSPLVPWTIALMISPMVGFGSFLVTPDVPLMFFWSLSTLMALRLIDRPRSRDYIFLGIALGLGFCSKYHIVLWPISMLVYMWRERQWSVLRARGIVLTAIFGALFSLPVIVWNLQNNLASFRFQIDHGFNQGPWDWRWTTDYILGQAFALIPFVFTRNFFLLPSDPKKKLHFFLGWSPLAFFLVSSLRGPVEMNWPMMTFPHLSLLFFCVVKQPKYWSKIYQKVWIPLIAAVLFCAYFPQYNFLHEKLNEPKKYANGVHGLELYRPLYTSTYQIAASLWYFSGIPTYKLRGQSRYDLFDELEGSIPLGNKFFYLKEDYQDLPQDYLNANFQFRQVATPFKGHRMYEVTKR